MSTGERHPLDTPPLGAVVLALSFVALLALGVTATAAASASSRGAHARAALILVTESRAAMSAAGSVSANGSGQVHVPGLGEETLTESDYVSAASGSQVVTVTSGGGGGATLPSATTLDLAGTVDVDANAPFWKDSMGVGGVQAAEVADRWVQVPKTSPVYAPAAADLTMPSLTQDLFDATTYHEGKTGTVDGVRTVAITYRNGGNDAGSVTCYVAVGGSHLPVEVTIGGLTLHLGAWGKVRALTAPTGVIPLPAVAAPTPSGTPVVA
jgi:hypothetical protein